MGLGIWGNVEQSTHEPVISDYKLSLIAAIELACEIEDINVLGYFDIPENHPDRHIGDTTYIQAFELEYPLVMHHKEWHNPGFNHALYGVTDEGKVHLWAN